MFTLLLIACASSPSDSADTAEPGDSAEVDRGPTTLEVDGDPNGLWWDGEELIIADDDNNRILRWTDEGGLSRLGELIQPGESGAGLGQPVRLPNGTVVVPRFGYGTHGDVVTLAPDGTSTAVPDLDLTRRRIGLAMADDGSLYDGWFFSGESGRVGAVSKLDLSGSETDFLTGLGKPVGVLVAGDTLYVSDQDTSQVLAAPLADPDALTQFAQVDAPDLLCAGPEGSLFTGGLGGDVRRIGADGSVTTFATGFREIRGVAYDDVQHRLFVVDHDGDEADGLVHSLQILPVD